MKISEVIKTLTEIMKKEGDLRVTTYDEYTANEGYGYNRDELWIDVDPCLNWVEDNEYNEIEKVVLM